MKQVEKVLIVLLTFILCLLISFASADLKNFDFQYTILDDGTVEITKYLGNSESVDFPKQIDGHTISSIGAGAFENCSTLKNIYYFSNCSVISIGDRAFKGCTSLEYIDTPQNLISIGNSAFEGCTKLENAYYMGNSPITAMGERVFMGCTSLVYIDIPSELVLIPDSAFEGCTKLENAYYMSSGSVTAIGERAFMGCTSLVYIDIPSGLAIIPDSAFEGCTKLEKAYYMSNSAVTKIGKNAFKNCSNLVDIDASEGLIEIGESAFEGCTNLERIYYLNENNVTIGVNAFAGCTNLRNVPKNAVIDESKLSKNNDTPSPAPTISATDAPAPVINPSSPDHWICQTCGNEASGNFCNLCGMANPADEWICPNCKNEANGNFCNNCGAQRPKGSIQQENTPSEQVPDSTPTAESNYINQDTVVKNYLGRSLSLCGYTSMGGERRDKYAGTTLLLIMQSTDGIYIDPEDDAALDAYKVIAQYPAPDTPFTVSSNPDGGQINPGYGEIVLIVSKNGETVENIPTLTNLHPSPNKTIQYVRDYRGRMLEDAGYTAMNGKRMDKYGPNGYVQLAVFDEKGQKIEPTINDDDIYYVVVDQDVQPDTEITFYYTDEKCTGQTIDVIQITVKKTEAGQATMEALAAEEEELRASGALKDLYQGTYEVGQDLASGNYEFTQISNSCNLYIYRNKTALDNKDGDWCYLYGKGDIETWYLKDGMYVTVSDGAAKAKRSEFSTGGSEFLLFSGVYRVGEDIAPGNYEMTHYTNSCNVYLYQTETAYQEKDGKWDYLYGKGDTEYYVLKEGMVVSINGGAASVTRK